MPVLTASEYDDRHDTNVYIHATVDELVLTDEPIQRHRIESLGELSVDLLVLPKPGRRMTVALHGAYGDEAQPPRFQFLRSTRDRDESMVYLADPTIEANPELFIGWYIGTAAQPAVPHLVRALERLAELLVADEIVLYGHSGGGFAAQTLGHRIENSVSVMLNAQTRPGKFYSYRAEPFRAFAFPNCADFDEAEHEHPEMLDLRALDRVPGARNHRVLAYQAPGDDLHWREHWLPWAASHGVGEDGGRSKDGKIEFRLADWGDSHAGPPSVHPYIDAAYRLFDNPNAEPEVDYDNRHRAAISTYGAIDSIRLTGIARQRIRVEEEGELALDALLLARRSARLTVAFHGAFGSEVTPPRFQYLRSTEGREESLLFVADPTLEVEPSLGLAWYVGTGDRPAAARIASLVRKVAELAGAEQVVLYGHSGGGFAAAAVGHGVPDSVSLMLNAQTRISKYHAWTHEPFRRVAFPQCADLGEVESLYAPLVDLRALYAAEPAVNHLVLALQTKGDALHWDEHWRPFAASLGLSGEGTSEDGRFEFRRARWGETHAGPPRLDPYLDEAHAMLANYLDR